MGKNKKGSVSVTSQHSTPQSTKADTPVPTLPEEKRSDVAPPHQPFEEKGKTSMRPTTDDKMPSTVVQPDTTHDGSDKTPATPAAMTTATSAPPSNTAGDGKSQQSSSAVSASANPSKHSEPNASSSDGGQNNSSPTTNQPRPSPSGSTTSPSGNAASAAITSTPTATPATPSSTTAAQGSPNRGGGAGGGLKRTMSRATLIRQCSASLLRASSKPSIIRQTSGTMLFCDSEESRKKLEKRASRSLIPVEELDTTDDEIAATSTGIEVVYMTGWSQPYLHVCDLHPTDGQKKWTPLPGIPFQKRMHPKFPNEKDGVWCVHLPDATGIEFVPNSGQGQWDKAPGNLNYTIPHCGVFQLMNGRIEQLVDPTGPPSLLTAKEVGGSFVCLVWAPPAIGPELVTAYRLYRDGTLIHQTEEEDQLTYTDNTVLGLQDYSYTLTTLNIRGDESKPSDTCSVKTAEPGKPSAPQRVRCVAHGASSITIAWSPPAEFGGRALLAYRVLRDGKPLSVVVLPKPLQPRPRFSSSGCLAAPKAGKDGDETEEWTAQYEDTSVESGKTYEYQITALQALPKNQSGEATPPPPPASTAAESSVTKDLRLPENSPSSDSGSSVQTELLIAKDDEELKLYESIPSSPPLAMKAIPQLNIPRLGERGKCHIIMQGFDWHSCHTSQQWYKTVKSRIEDLKKSGVSMVWLPPPAQSVDENGYLPQNWYNLNSKYGTADDLKDLINSLKREQIAPMADVVVNHRCAVQKGKNGMWTEFKSPDWSDWAICCNDPKMPGSGAPSTGETIDYAPDIDHTNHQVQKDVKEWLKWLFSDEVGFCAIRLDFVLGYAPRFQLDYMQSIDAPFTVAEYWSGDQRVLEHYVHATKGAIAVFDFPLYYHLRNAIHSNDFQGLTTNGRLNAIVGHDPVRAVTFVDNHDTSHLEIVGGAFGNDDQVLRGYALLLTHPGTPCVFWGDWEGRSSHVKNKIMEMGSLRREMEIWCKSGIYVAASHHGLYAAYINPAEGHCGKGGGRVAMKIGSNDWSPEGGGWKPRVWGNDFCIWSK